VGHLLFATGSGTDTFEQFVLDLSATGLPCAVLDEGGERSLPRSVGRGRIKLFSIAGSPGSGAAVGRHLCALGHRTVVYLSPLHETSWSQARLEGLTQVLAQAGGTVHAVVRSDLTHESLLQLGVHAPAGAGRPEWLARVPRSALHERLAMGVDVPAEETQRNRAFAAVLEPLMEQALRIPQATAWVCATDYFALMAVHYLQSRGRQVPADISVAGFDDSYAAFLHGLTSCNFSGPAYMRAMLRWVLNPSDRLTAGLPGATVEIESCVTARRSTSLPVSK
jgi:DNA-binding LacI/PurR family transcriptional regulator